MNLQKVIWHDETLKAEVFDYQGKLARVIQYTKKEYDECKQLYIQMGGSLDDERR